MDQITNTQDYIDSRDVIERIDELTADAAYLDEAERDELRALKELAREGEDYAPDWEYGATLIRDSYFKEYAQELAEDCGMVEQGQSWPNYCIDWERAARDLQMDYSAVEFDGVTYWVR